MKKICFQKLNNILLFKSLGSIRFFKKKLILLFNNKDALNS